MDHVHEAGESLRTAMIVRDEEDKWTTAMLEAAIHAVVSVADSLARIATAMEGDPTRHGNIGLHMVYQEYGAGRMDEDDARERINVIKGGFANTTEGAQVPSDVAGIPHIPMNR